MLPAVKAAGVFWRGGTAVAVVGAEELSAEADDAISVQAAVISGAAEVSGEGASVAKPVTESSVVDEDTASVTVVFGSSEPEVVAEVTAAEVLPAGDSGDES